MINNIDVHTRYFWVSHMLTISIFLSWDSIIVFMHPFSFSIKYSNLIVNEVNNLEFKMHSMQTIDILIFHRRNHTILKITYFNNIHIYFIQIFFMFILFTKIYFTRIICFCILWLNYLKIGIIWFGFSYNIYFFTIIGIISFSITLNSFIFPWVYFILFWCNIALMWTSYTWQHIIIILCGMVPDEILHLSYSRTASQSHITIATGSPCNIISLRRGDGG